jgi:hypothetical protein
MARRRPPRPPLVVARGETVFAVTLEVDPGSDQSGAQPRNTRGFSRWSSSGSTASWIHGSCRSACSLIRRYRYRVVAVALQIPVHAPAVDERERPHATRSVPVRHPQSSKSSTPDLRARSSSGAGASGGPAETTASTARGEACRRVLDRADGCLPHKTRLAAYDQRAAACPVTLSSCSDARAAWVCIPSWS